MRAWARVMQACGGISAAILGLLVVLVVWDVVARNLGARSLVWILEVTEYGLPLAHQRSMVMNGIVTVTSAPENSRFRSQEPPCPTPPSSMSLRWRRT